MKRFSTYHYVLAGSVLGTTMVLAFISSQVIYYARQHVWLAMLPAMLAVFLSLWLMVRISSRFPGKSMFQILRKKPWAGRAFIALYAFYFLLIMTRDLKIMTDFCDIFLLQNTPHFILMSLLLLPMTLIVRAGTETMVRMTEILVPVSTAVLLAIPVLGTHSVDLNNLKPLFDFHWERIGFGSWYLFGYIGDLFLLPFLWSGSTLRMRAAAGAWALCGATLLMVFFFQVTVVGVAPSSRLTFATYELVRQLEITDFLDRFELIIVVFYFPVTVLKITYSLSLLCRSVAHIFPKLSSQALAAPIGLTSMISTFLLYDDLIQLYHLNTLWPYLTLFYGFALPFLILLIWRQPKPFLR